MYGIMQFGPKTGLAPVFLIIMHMQMDRFCLFTFILILFMISYE